MSKKKMYTLQVPLSADDLLDDHSRLDRLRGYGGPVGEIVLHLMELQRQAKADREADDLRLPWRVRRTVHESHKTWTVMDGEENLGWGTIGQYTEAQVKLMSAAPELLEAVQAMRDWAINGFAKGTNWDTRVEPIVQRALRKVSTGVPE